jgi:hypothetical protein
MSPRVKDIIISSVISIAITIVYGYYFLYVGYKLREPTFFVDPIRTTILDKTNAADAPLHLLTSKGDTITSDVVSVYFYFFNQGEETIKSENVYAPVNIWLDTASRILDFKMIKKAREVSGIQVSVDSTSRFLNVGFRALEKDDGFVGQVIFAGNKDSQLYIEGGIEGAKEFKGERAAIDPFYFMIAATIFLIAAYIFLIVYKDNPKSVPRFLFFFSMLPLIFLLLMLYKSTWFMEDKVPETLLVEQYRQESRAQFFALPSWFRF